MTDIIDAVAEPIKPAQTVAPATEPTAWMSPDGEIRDGAPENIRTLMEAKKWNNIHQLAGGYTELEKFTGVGEHLVIPEAEDAEGWNNVFKKLGRPETFDKYEFSPEGDIPVSDELLNGFKQFAHKEGYTQKQLAGAVQFQLDAIAESDKIFKQQTADREIQNIQAMKNKWGEANYDSVFRGIEATAEKLKILGFLRERGIDKEPEIVNMLLTITNSDAEEVIHPASPVQPQKSPHERLGEIKKSEAFTNKFHEDHRKVMIEYMALNQEIANSGQAKAPRM